MSLFPVLRLAFSAAVPHLLASRAAIVLQSVSFSDSTVTALLDLCRRNSLGFILSCEPGVLGFGAKGLRDAVVTLPNLVVYSIVGCVSSDIPAKLAVSEFSQIPLIENKERSISVHLVSQEVSDVDVDSITALPDTFAECLPPVCLPLVISEAQMEEGEVFLTLFKIGERLDRL